MCGGVRVDASPAAGSAKPTLLAAYSSIGRRRKRLGSSAHAAGSFCALCSESIAVCSGAPPAERSTYAKPETGAKRRMTSSTYWGSSSVWSREKPLGSAAASLWVVGWPHAARVWVVAWPRVGRAWALLE